MASRPNDDPALRDALAALESMLARRTATLMDEVAHYPTPIARCDEQLTKLIEQRTQAVSQLRAVRELSAAAQTTASRDWLARVSSWLDDYPSTDDADEAASIAHLRSAASAASAARP
jgi:hypothetical protein